MALAYTAHRIFSGEDWLLDHAIIVDSGIITGVIPASQVPDNIPITDFGANLIAPAFIDLQIYGAKGKLFSVYQDSASLELLSEHCEKGGTCFCLPTVATNSLEVFYSCIDAIRNYWQHGGKGILGIHLEGPWINPKRRGAHIESLVHQPTIEEVTALLEHGKGVIKMITLAPERCSEEIIDYILSKGIVVSAGHSDASYEEATQSFDKGIATVTHLYNAMSPLSHRAPGLVGAAMDHSGVMASIIPDGYHSDFAAVRIAKKTMGNRLFAITDAVTDTLEGPYPHKLAGDKYESDNILSGSSLTMIDALRNLVNFAGIPLSEALRMCSLYPAKVIGLGGTHGEIKNGFTASLVIIDEQLKQVVRVIK